MRDISSVRLYSFLVHLSQNFRQTAVIFQSRAQYMFVQGNQKREHLVLAKILRAKKVHQKISNPKKVPSREFQTQKRSSHVPVTNIPEYPPWVGGTLFSRSNFHWIAKHLLWGKVQPRFTRRRHQNKKLLTRYTFSY